MASVPKRVLERFRKHVPKFQRLLQVAVDRDVNESDTVSIVQDVFGDVLGYDKYLEVTSEYAIRGTRCDLALKVDGKVQFLVEVKAACTTLRDNHKTQAVNYGATKGIPWVILTNGVDWQVYRVRLNEGVNEDLVCAFHFPSLSAKDDRDTELLYLLAKEGLSREVREDYYERVQSVNRFIIGQMILSDAILVVLRRELKKLSEGMRVDLEEIRGILSTEVLKRDLVEGDEAEAARSRVTKFYRKTATRKRRKTDASAAPSGI